AEHSGAAREALLCQRAAAAYERGSDFDASLKWLDYARKVLPPRKPRIAAQIAVARCVSLYRTGRMEEALTSGREGLKLARRCHDLLELAHAHNMIASPLQRLGRLRASTYHRTRAVELYDKTGDLPGQARAHTNLGNSLA